MQVVILQKRRVPNGKKKAALRHTLEHCLVFFFFFLSSLAFLTST